MSRSSLAAVAALALAFAPAAWGANAITSIQPEANRVTLENGKASVRFMVSGRVTEEGDCGIWVSYGDQDSPDTRIIGRKDGVFPREFSHTFNHAGQFTVTARGQRVKQTFGCDGEASTSITVVDSGRGRGRTAGAACPDGWEIRDGSFNRQTGAFTCEPLYPAQRMECGPGLRYFERDNLIGCRARGDGQR